MYSLRWRHSEWDGVSNHQPHDCLLNRLSGHRSKKTLKPRVTGLCAWNSPGPMNSPHKWPVTRKPFPFDDVIMLLRVVLSFSVNACFVWSISSYSDFIAIFVTYHVLFCECKSNKSNRSLILLCNPAWLSSFVTVKSIHECDMDLNYVWMKDAGRELMTWSETGATIKLTKHCNERSEIFN